MKLSRSTVRLAAALLGTALISSACIFVQIEGDLPDDLHEEIRAELHGHHDHDS